MKYTWCHIAEQYIDDVKNKRIVVGNLVYLAVERHIKDLLHAPENGWYFDKDAAEEAIKFKTLFKHTYGEMAGQQFTPEPWQCFMDYCVYGWKNANGRRRFSTAYIEVAKKNGKTAKIALDATYILSADRAPSGETKKGVEVYCAATQERQAKEVFNQAVDFIEDNNDFISYFQPKIVTNNISIKSKRAKFEPLGRDSKGKDGKRPDGVVIDEYHEWDKDDVRHRLRSASVGKVNYLEWIITTAGLDKTGPCYDWRKYCIDILMGIKKQDDVFVLIFSLDEGDNWKDPEVWPKANPNYGVSVDKENMQKLFKEALNRGGQQEVDFKTKNLNTWVDAPTVWISDDKIRACNHGITTENLVGKTCFAGLDLASHRDISVLALYFPDIKGHKAAKLFYFIPEAKVIQDEDRVDYRRWVQQGHIILSPGDVIDIDFQVDFIYKNIQKYDCRNIAFDPAKAYHGTIQSLQKYRGMDKLLDEFSQRIQIMSAPTYELERIIMSEEIDFLNDPVIRWMFRNCVPYKDHNKNIKINKEKEQNKIDGVIALINAIGGSMSGDKIKPYENHGIRTVNF